MARLESGAAPESGRPRRVLVVHNRYRLEGGEDAVVRDECALLRRHGIEVEVYERDNAEIGDTPGASRVRLAFETIWSGRTTAEISRIAERFRPDVVHAHNTFPLISPSLYFAAARRRIPVVQTLHNFRLFCAQAMFLREGRVCEDCLGTLPWRGVIRRCYRGSFSQSAVLVAMQGTHRALGSYRHRVTRYIALNRFCRDKFVAAGLPGERVVIKPNFVDLPASPSDGPRGHGLFVGRLAPEKGISTLARALASLPECTRVDVLGSGPEEGAFAGLPGVRLLGWQPQDFIYGRMRSAAYLLLPSLWYENFPRTLVEAFACGLPVIASRIGALAELVRDGETGLLFSPGNAAALAERIAWAEAHPEAMRAMGEAARREYLARYTPQANFTQLSAIYREAIAAH